jgi:hypothetical protein
MNRRPSFDPSRTYPVVATLAALDAWQRDPTVARLGELREALVAVVRTAGAEGAYLVIDAPPLPPLRTGVGTLSEGPERDDRTISFHRLEAEDGGGSLGLNLERRAQAAAYVAKHRLDRPD